MPSQRQALRAFQFWQSNFGSQNMLWPAIQINGQAQNRLLYPLEMLLRH